MKRTFRLPCSLLISAAIGFVVGVWTPLFSQILSTRIATADWEIQPWSDVRLGRLSVSHDPAGEILSVQILRDSIPELPGMLVPSATPKFTGNYFLLSNFDFKAANGLGGIFNAFYREPSTAAVEYADDQSGRRALQLSYHKGAAGFCGMWIHLFNSRMPAPARVFLDSRSFTALTFWIRGRIGQERLTLKVADSEWLRKEDALPIGDVARFLSKKAIDTTWQLAVVPLQALPSRINRTQLASLVFEANGPESGEIQIKTMAFCVTRFPLPPLPQPATNPATLRTLDKAIWVWSTDRILGKKEAEDTLVTFLVDEHCNRLFLALPYEATSFQSLMGITLRAERFRPLLSRLNAAGIHVHALLGDKDFILPDRRPFVTATLENIARYNTSSKPGERFTGIHLDVEPYLLPGFGGKREPWIVGNYLALLSLASDIAHKSGMEIGADIPSWFDAPDEYTGRMELVDYKGTSRPIDEHVINLMDIIVLMGYRTAAFGADGMILNSLGEVDYASKSGKQVFVGLETGPIVDENIISFRGTPQRGLQGLGSSDAEVVLVPGRDSADVYLVQSFQRAEFEKLFNDKSKAASALCWPIQSSSFVPGDKLSFATLRPARLTRSMEEALSELGQTMAFRGFAIHFYESYVKLLTGNRR